jgi:hypothetical protein
MASSLSGDNKKKDDGATAPASIGRGRALLIARTRF